MVDFLQQIPGPLFLAYFAAMASCCTILAYLLAYADGTKDHPMPDPWQFPPWAVAALRGGPKLALQSAVFGLWQKELLEFRGSDANTEVVSVHSPQCPGDPIEQAVYDFCRPGRRATEVQSDYTLEQAIASYCEPVFRQMEQLRLLRTEHDKSRAWTAAWTTLFAAALVGLTKLHLGVTRGKPVLFLVLLMLVWVAIHFIVVKPWSNLTRLGQAYLASIRHRFSSVKQDLAANPELAGANSTMFVAAFGVAALAGVPYFDSLTQHMGWRREGGDYGGSSGGCGGSSGCGGGCGGGGCGGCGS